MSEGKARQVPCDKIRAALFDYFGRELGPEQAWLVREHLRSCPDCTAEAARVERMLAALRDAPAETPPETLPPSFRRRLARAVMHPVLDWICVHHRLVAWMTAFAVLGAVFALAWHCRFKPDTVIYWLR